MTSARSFLLLPFPGPELRTRGLAPCKRSDKGATDGVAPSSSISPSDDASSLNASVESLRFLTEACCTANCAHSGGGLRTWNCFRNRRVYSSPLTTSSASVFRSFRNRGAFANDTSTLSSSLSSQAAVPLALFVASSSSSSSV
jgi:hypothetical protein